MQFLILLIAACLVSSETAINTENEALVLENAQLMRQIEQAIGRSDENAINTENKALALENAQLMRQIEQAIGRSDEKTMNTEHEALVLGNAQLMRQIEQAIGRSDENQVGGGCRMKPSFVTHCQKYWCNSDCVNDGYQLCLARQQCEWSGIEVSVGQAGGAAGGRGGAAGGRGGAAGGRGVAAGGGGVAAGGRGVAAGGRGVAAGGRGVAGGAAGGRGGTDSENKALALENARLMRQIERAIGSGESRDSEKAVASRESSDWGSSESEEVTVGWVKSKVDGDWYENEALLPENQNSNAAAAEKKCADITASEAEYMCTSFGELVWREGEGTPTYNNEGTLECLYTKQSMDCGKKALCDVRGKKCRKTPAQTYQVPTLKDVDFEAITWGFAFIGIVAAAYALVKFGCSMNKQYEQIVSCEEI